MIVEANVYFCQMIGWTRAWCSISLCGSFCRGGRLGWGGVLLFIGVEVGWLCWPGAGGCRWGGRLLVCITRLGWRVTCLACQSRRRCPPRRWRSITSCLKTLVSFQQILAGDGMCLPTDQLHLLSTWPTLLDFCPDSILHISTYNDDWSPFQHFSSVMLAPYLTWWLAHVDVRIESIYRLIMLIVVSSD